MFNKLLVLLMVVGLISCGENASEQSEMTDEAIADEVVKLELNDLQWMEGMWVDNSTFAARDMVYLEEWTYYPDSLSGRGLSVENGDTTQTEQLAIRIIEERLMYVARPFDQPVIGFPATEESKNQMVFENKAHDFPQNIAYERRGDDSLIIDLKGFVLPQGDKIMKFKLKKVSL